MALTDCNCCDVPAFATDIKPRYGFSPIADDLCYSHKASVGSISDPTKISVSFDTEVDCFFFFGTRTTVYTGRSRFPDSDSYDTSGSMTIIETMDPDTGEVTTTITGALTVTYPDGICTCTWDGNTYTPGGGPGCVCGDFWAALNISVTLSDPVPMTVRFTPPPLCFLKFFWANKTNKGNKA